MGERGCTVHRSATSGALAAGVSSGRRRRSLLRLTRRRSAPILSDIVNYQQRLDRTFAALVDPTRRAILAQLERKDGASVGELAAPFAIKLPAVMKHLAVLAEAGLITRTKSGRTVTVRLRPQPMREAIAWLSRYERFWAGSLDRLTAYAERKEAERRGRQE
ncbi:MAG: metalloregulator ArsR/SmtB family transcription factor [Steroidobacteraceae bacterium]|jgi:DNA-binding transcriptional ArsR family regulator